MKVWNSACDVWQRVCLLVAMSTALFPCVAAADSTTLTVTVQSAAVCGDGVKEIGEQCDGSDFGGKSCADLGYKGGTLACSASCEYNTMNCTTNAETSATPSFSSSIGGTYTLTHEDGAAKVVLPENFYSEDAQLKMFSYDKSIFESSKPAPSGENFIGKTYDFVFVNKDGAVVTTITQPATLTLTYTAADVSGIDERTIAPYRRESGDSSWQLIPGATIDTVNKRVTFSTTNFSSFALFGSAAGGSRDSGAGVMQFSPGTVSSAPTIPIQPVHSFAVAGSSATFLRDLWRGTRGEDVARLQKLLGVEPQSGFFGQLTQQAVRAFQKKYGLPQVGRVGPRTRAKLQEVFSVKVETPAIPPPVVQTRPSRQSLIDAIRAEVDVIWKLVQSLLARFQQKR